MVSLSRFRISFIKPSLAFDHMLCNAIKFTEKISITLTLKIKSSLDYINLCVIDTDIDITKKDPMKLFQPFRKIRSHPSCRHKGTGLRLT